MSAVGTGIQPKRIVNESYFDYIMTSFGPPEAGAAK